MLDLRSSRLRVQQGGWTSCTAGGQQMMDLECIFSKVGSGFTSKIIKVSLKKLSLGTKMPHNVHLLSLTLTNVL